MLNPTKKLKTLLGITAAVLTIAIAIPGSGSISLVSSAIAGEGGGDGSDRMDNFFGEQARQDRIDAFNRRQAARRAALNARRAAQRAARQAARDARRAARKAARAVRRAAQRAARGARYAANPTWASSTDTRTGVTTTSRGLPNGSHQVTVTNAAGVVIDSYVVN